jgi:hypothetical protein
MAKCVASASSAAGATDLLSQIKNIAAQRAAWKRGGLKLSQLAGPGSALEGRSSTTRTIIDVVNEGAQHERTHTSKANGGTPSYHTQ